MNRRNFLSLAALAIAGKAAERVFPFRVYSIPKEIASPKWDQLVMLPPSSFDIPIEYARLAMFPSPLQNGRIVNIRTPKHDLFRSLLHYQNAMAEEMTLYGSGVMPRLR